MSMKIRPGYKKTELGIFPEDWELFCLSELAELTSSKRIFENDYVPTGVPFYRGKEISLLVSQKTIEDPQFISEKKFNEIKQKFGAPEAGDILITAVGTLGNIYVVNNNIPFYFKDGNLIWLRKINSSDSNYIGAQLEKNKSKILDGAIGSSQKALTIVVLKKLQIPVAPLLEQRAIAGALSDMDRLISSLDQLIAKKRDIQQASMQQLLTGQRRLPGFSEEWEVKQLGDIVELIMGQSPSSSNYNRHGDGLPLIQGNADIADRITIKRIFTTELTKLGKCGDILLSVRAPVGEVARAAFDVCLGRGVCAIRGGSEFLYHYLISIESSWARLSKGSTFDSINSAELRTLELRLPPSQEEQSAIATILSDMDSELAALETRRDKARQLKQGMKQELLTGRIRLV